MSRLTWVLVAIFVLVSPVTTAAADEAPADTIAVIGDSLTDQRGAGQARTEQALQERGYGGGGIFFWGVGGKRLLVPDAIGTTTLENIRAARAELGHVDTWLIALGTNDRFDSTSKIRRRVDRILDALGKDRFVWIGLGFYNADSALSRRVNDVLKDAISARPNGRYASWNRFIHHPTRDAADLWTFPKDELHMTEKGYLLRANFYARKVD